MPFKYVFHLVVLFCYANAMCGQYRIPKPTFTVYDPRGLRISIPDARGVNLVVFYVSINRSLLGEEPDYTEYVVKEVDGKWTFDKNIISLIEGDVVYHKIFVQRYRRGYLYHGSPYIVTKKSRRPTTYRPPIIYDDPDDCVDIMPEDTTVQIPLTTSPKYYTSTSTTPPTTTNNSANPSDVCPSTLETVLKLLSTVQNELRNANTDLEILKELTAGQPLQLHMSGPVTETGQPKDVVEFVLFERLNTRQKVKSATKEGQTITFELYSFEQKLDILKRAKKYIKDSKTILITP